MLIHFLYPPSYTKAMHNCTQKHVCEVYGPLGKGGSRLNHNIAPAVGHMIQQLYPNVTESAAKSMAHHLKRAASINIHKTAAEALSSLGKDFGLVPAVKAMEKLPDDLADMIRNSTLAQLLKGFEAYEQVEGGRKGRGRRKVARWFKHLGRSARKAARPVADELMSLARSEAEDALTELKHEARGVAREKIGEARESARDRLFGQGSGVLAGGELAGAVREAAAKKRADGPNKRVTALFA